MPRKNKLGTIIFVIVLILILLYVYYKDYRAVSQPTLIMATISLFLIVYNISSWWPAILYTVCCIIDFCLWIYLRGSLVYLFSVLRDLEKHGSYGVLLPSSSPQSLCYFTNTFLFANIVKIMLLLMIVVSFRQYKLSRNSIVNKNTKYLRLFPDNKYHGMIKLVLLLSGTFLCIGIQAHQSYASSYMLFVNSDFIFIVALFSVFIALFKVTPSVAVLFVMLVILNSLFFIIDNIRDLNIYSQLMRISNFSGLSNNVVELFPDGLPTHYILIETAFYGNILLPWIPDQPHALTGKSFMLLPVVTLYIMLYCYYCNHMAGH